MAFRVLVLDDEKSARESMREALEAGGYEVVTSSTAPEALEAQRSFDPDVIVSDVNMPGMNGWAFLRELGERPEAPPSIMVTSHGSQEVAVESLRQGAFDYITKPFDPEQFRKSVRRAAEQHNLRRENLHYQ